MKNILCVFLFFLFSCNSTKEIYESKFEVDSSEVDNVLFRIEEANLSSIKREREMFLNSEYKNNSIYLNTLNWYINNEISTADYTLLRDGLIEVFKRIEKKDISKLYVLNMRYSGEMFYEKVVIIVEEKNSYSPTMFLYNNSSGKIEVKYILDSSVQFLNEFVDNLRYSYLSKSYFNNPPQSFFVSKISIKEGEIKKIENTFKVEMLYSEMEILNKFFIDK
jgi:hypothetical protein